MSVRPEKKQRHIPRSLATGDGAARRREEIGNAVAAARAVDAEDDDHAIAQMVAVAEYFYAKCERELEEQWQAMAEEVNALRERVQCIEEEVAENEARRD